MTIPLQERTAWSISWALTIVVAALVTVLFRLTGIELSADFDVHIFPRFHAILNSLVAVCLVIGLVFIKRKNVTAHKRMMLSALILSALFLLSYVTYHSLSSSTSYGGEGVLRMVYYVVLISHIILAGLVFPFILMSFYYALNDRFDKHRRLAKVVWPVWFYVAVTGVVVYVMISPYYA